MNQKKKNKIKINLRNKIPIDINKNFEDNGKGK